MVRDYFLDSGNCNPSVILAVEKRVCTLIFFTLNVECFLLCERVFFLLVSIV